MSQDYPRPGRLSTPERAYIHAVGRPLDTFDSGRGPGLARTGTGKPGPGLATAPGSAGEAGRTGTGKPGPGLARGSTSAVITRGYKTRVSGEPKARPLTPRAEARGMLRVNTERRFYTDLQRFANRRWRRRTYQLLTCAISLSPVVTNANPKARFKRLARCISSVSVPVPSAGMNTR